ncbi:MAG: TolC family protein, partial [Desulfuromonadaceae bacterium]|nr:TolC family protein [Desulfuromonadaceae bacterium]
MSFTTMMRSAVPVLLLQVVLCSPVSAVAAPRSINEITALALKQSAELTALKKEEAAQQSLAIQAGTFNNPTLELQGDSGTLTGGSEERSLFIGINQEFPLNNKLTLRREAGERGAESVQRQLDNATRLLKDDITSLSLDY